MAESSHNPFRRVKVLSATATAFGSDAAAEAEHSLFASAAPGYPQPGGPAEAGAPAPSAFAFNPSPSGVFAQRVQQHDQSEAQTPFEDLSYRHPAGDNFREQLMALPKSSEAPPSTTFLKSKPVKKVRVQSPPPPSPDSDSDSTGADFKSRFPANGPPALTALQQTHSGLGDSGGGREGGNGSGSGAERYHTSGSEEGAIGDLELHGGDAKRSGGGLVAGPVGTGALDVDAFRRLLLTGEVSSGTNANAASSIPPQQPDTGSITDASSVSKQSIFDTAHPLPQETPRTSHEISETDDDRSGLIQSPLQMTTSQRQTLRKKPPPPSSRHGKLIKMQLKDKDALEASSGTVATSQSPSYRKSSIGSSIHSLSLSPSSDVNKPLPLPPQHQSLDGGDESIFDREAAGKVPEVDLDPDVSDDDVLPPAPPTPPNASHSVFFRPSRPTSDTATENLASAASKPATKPMPPPRRHTHTRSDSRSSAHERPLQFAQTQQQQQQQQLPQASSSGSGVGITKHRDRSPGGSRRSSIESTRSRSSSIKLSINASAPAPPPPRRPNHGARPSVAFISPSSLSFTSVPSSVSSPSLASEFDRSPSDVLSIANATAQPRLATAPVPLPSPSAKAARPPPPPTRSASVRTKEGRSALQSDGSGVGVGGGRPPSISGVDAVSRRGLIQGSQQPPPPPPRQRGSSRGSMDGPSGAPAFGTVQSRQASGENAKLASSSVAEEDEEADAGAAGSVPPAGAASNILADLDALQREVDALRGQYGKTV